MIHLMVPHHKWRFYTSVHDQEDNFREISFKFCTNTSLGTRNALSDIMSSIFLEDDIYEENINYIIYDSPLRLFMEFSESQQDLAVYYKLRFL